MKKETTHQVGPWYRVLICHCGEVVLDGRTADICPKCGCEGKWRKAVARQEWDHFPGQYGSVSRDENEQWVEWTGCTHG